MQIVLTLIRFHETNPALVGKCLSLVLAQVLHSPGVLRGQRPGLLPEAAQAYVRERGPLHHHADC